MNGDMDWLKKEKEFAEYVTCFSRMAFWIMAACTMAAVAYAVLFAGGSAVDPGGQDVFGPAVRTD